MEIEVLISKEFRELNVPVLKQWAFQKRANADPRFWFAFQKEYDLSGEVNDARADAINAGEGGNFNQETTGLANQGKSYLTMTDAKISYPEFSIESCFFSLGAISNARKNFRERSAVMKDEKKGEVGAGTVRRAMEYFNMLESIRARGISFFNCGQVRMIASHAVYEFEALYVDRVREVVHAAVYSKESEGTFGLLGWRDVPHPKTVFKGEWDEFVKGYNEKKNAHIDELLNRGTMSDYQVKALEMLDVPTMQLYVKAAKAKKRLPTRGDVSRQVNLKWPQYNHNNESELIVDYVLGALKDEMLLAGAMGVSDAGAETGIADVAGGT